jgi:hypothetical protein
MHPSIRKSRKWYLPSRLAKYNVQALFILYACYTIYPDQHKNNWKVQIMKIFM